MIKMDNNLRGKICESLLKYDESIVEIIQFGSSVYAPEYARDLDLLVITKEKKEYEGYLDSLDELELPFDVDVVVRGAGAVLKSSFVCQIFGAFEILYGDGGYLAGITKNFDPSFEEAYVVLRKAKRDMAGVAGLEIKEDKEWSIRVAFEQLFHASRLGVMTHLATENASLGKLKIKLRQPYKSEFEAFINTLHIDYFYNGNYPENYEEEFERWHKRVEGFVKELGGK